MKLDILPRENITIIAALIRSENENISNRQLVSVGLGEIDALMLLSFLPNNTVRVSIIPVDIAINLPGSNNIQPLSVVFSKGGIALTADVLNEILSLPDSHPQRYILISREGIERVLGQLGVFEIASKQMKLKPLGSLLLNNLKMLNNMDHSQSAIDAIYRVLETNLTVDEFTSLWAFALQRINQFTYLEIPFDLQKI